MKIMAVLLAFFFLNVSSSVQGAQKLLLPRFACLRSGEVNVRVGPGSEYPIEWILKYEKMPVEIISEFDVWRKIRDFEGSEGWVHQSMLSGVRMAMLIGDQTLLKKSPDAQAAALAKIETGVLGRLMECKEGWCRLHIQGYKGWVPRSTIWGLYPSESKF